jgi:hypothetical protein
VNAEIALTTTRASVTMVTSSIRVSLKVAIADPGCASIARSEGDEAIQSCFRAAAWIASLALAMTV